MPIDTLLVLDSGQTVTADANTDYIECEGGFFSLVLMQLGVLSGGSTTLDVRLMVSQDNGSNYYMYAKLQQAGPSDDSKLVAAVAYIPMPDTAGDRVRVRLAYDVTGVSPSYAITRAWLEPMLSLAPPDLHEQAETGLAIQMAAV